MWPKKLPTFPFEGAAMCCYVLLCAAMCCFPLLYPGHEQQVLDLGRGTKVACDRSGFIQIISTKVFELCPQVHSFMIHEYSLIFIGFYWYFTIEILCVFDALRPFATGISQAVHRPTEQCQWRGRGCQTFSTTNSRPLDIQRQP